MMKKKVLKYSHVEGKTYTLFGDSNATSEYFNTIRELTDKILEKTPDILLVIKTMNTYSTKKRFLRKIIKNPVPDMLISEWLNLITPYLNKYTFKTKEHLKQLSISKLWDRTLSTTPEQYHLYMVEIELTNRLNAGLFKEAARKISLQPYCLQDFSVDSKAAQNGDDYQCKHCSKNCFQNTASLIIKKHNIESFIWMGADLKQLAKKNLDQLQSFAVLGIACIPELIQGLRKCRKYNIPAIGIPLNANRCIRWFGEFFQNSIDLNELENLIKV